MPLNADRVRALLKQTAHHDNDERYMATSDLTAELQNVDGIIEASLQLPIRNAIIRQLTDTSIDVQAMAVKCLALLVQKFSSDQVVDMVDRLGRLVVDENLPQESRDIYAVGLKTAISSVRTEDGEAIASKLVQSLLAGLQPSKPNEQLQMVCLEILKDTLSRFGSELSANHTHQQLVARLMPLLEHSSDSIRKRASLALGALVRDLGDEQFHSLMEHVIQRLEDKRTRLTILYTYIQTVSVVSRFAGVRVGKFAPKIIPMLFRFCQHGADEADVNEEQVDLWENCLQAFESLLVRCPLEATPFLERVVGVCLEFMQFDPNYSYDVEMQEEGRDGGGWGDEGDDEGRQGFEAGLESHDDDSTWKTRRAAVKAVRTFVTHRSDALPQFYGQLCDALVKQFRERDKSVRVEILTTAALLFKESVSAVGPGGLPPQSYSSGVSASAPTPSSMMADMDIDASHLDNVPSLIRETSCFQILLSKLDAIVAACHTQLQQSVSSAAASSLAASAETEKAALGVVQQLVLVCRNRLQPVHIDSLLPHVLRGCHSTDTILRAEALGVLLAFLKHQKREALVKYTDGIVDVSASASRDIYTRTRAEALRICGQLAINMAGKVECVPVADHLFSITYDVLVQKDMDQEVKDASITTMSQILSSFGQHMPHRLSQTLPIFVERLDNEVTRASALRAIAQLAGARESDTFDYDGVSEAKPAQLDLRPILVPTTRMLCRFLTLQSQTLKHESAKTLSALVRSCGAHMELASLSGLVREVASHIHDSDLHLSHLVLEIINSVIRSRPEAIVAEANALLPRLLGFFRSPLLQGLAERSLIAVFEQLVRVGSGEGSPSHERKAQAEGQEAGNREDVPMQDAAHQTMEGVEAISFERLLALLESQVREDLPKCSLPAIAQAIGGMCRQVSPERARAAVRHFAQAVGPSERHQIMGRQRTKQPRTEGQGQQLSHSASFDSVSSAKLHQQLALLVLGEIGRQMDLSRETNVEPIIMGAFNDPNLDVQEAASFALGNVAVGNLEKYLPAMLHRIREHPEEKYRLLGSLREVIIRHSTSAVMCRRLHGHVEEIARLLFENAEAKDESVRGMVSECLGRLAAISLDVVLPQLERAVQSSSALQRGVAITALCYAMSGESGQTVVHGVHLSRFLALLNDPDLDVRRQCLLSVNAIFNAHVDILQPDVIRTVVLPSLYATLGTELVRVVDYGPFRQNIDDALPLRKAAFQCLDTLLSVAPHRLNIKELISHIQRGITDHDDVQLLTYQMFYNLAVFHGQALLQELDDLPPLFTKGVKEKLKQAKEGEDAEKAKDVLRSAVRALFAMDKLPGVEHCPKFCTFYLRVLKTPLLEHMVNELKASR